jgi:hypothetical protein
MDGERFKGRDRRERKRNHVIAFHGEQSIKDKYVARAAAHRAAGEIRQNFGYWKRDNDNVMRDCAVGCTLHSSNHEAYETELGIPCGLAYLEDGLFERMTPERAKDWPVEFLMAVPVGADLSKVAAQMILWMLVDEKEGITAFDLSDNVKILARELAALYARSLSGDEPRDAEWDSVYSRTLRDLSDLSDLSDFRNLRNLRALSALRALNALSDLSALSALRALSNLRALSALRALNALSDLSDLSDLRALRALNALSDLSDLSALREIRDLSDLSAPVFTEICADQLLLFLRASRSSSAEGELLRRSGSTASPELLPW